jgi:hypothetical protein
VPTTQNLFMTNPLEKFERAEWVSRGAGWGPKGKQYILESLGEFEATNVLMYQSFDAAADAIRKQLRSYVSGVCRDRSVVQISLDPRKFFVSAVSQEMDQAISASRAILSLEVDPEAGITEPYTEETWDRAVKLLRSLAHLFLQASGELLPVPTIGPASDGSIDLFWKLNGLTLLINTPTDPAKNSTFFGRRLEGSKISGVLDRNDVEPLHLTGWLAGV